MVKATNDSQNSGARAYTIQIGLLVTIIVVMVTSAVVTYLLKPDIRATDVNLVDPNKDARNGIISLASAVITGCFALLQSSQQSVSSSNQKRLDDLEEIIQQQKKLQSVLQNSAETSTVSK